MEVQEVILVNEHDEPIGRMEKLQAHQSGSLHRAFSVFIFNERGEMLLQQRALEKYHSPGLWSNACCSHPRPGEETAKAAARRLQEELGFSAELEKIFDFTYQAALGDLIEHEFDHVFAGKYNGWVHPNKKEVMNWNYRSMTDLEFLLGEQPQLFTAWFKISFPKIKEWWQERFG